MKEAMDAIHEAMHRSWRSSIDAQEMDSELLRAYNTLKARSGDQLSMLDSSVSADPRTSSRALSRR